MSHSPTFQKLCHLHRRAVDALLADYIPIEEGDPRLKFAEPLTFPKSFRNATTREEIAHQLAELRIHRTHYLVRERESGDEVAIWVVKPDFDKDIASRDFDPSEVEVALRDPLGEILRSFDGLLKRIMAREPALRELLVRGAESFPANKNSGAKEQT